MGHDQHPRPSRADIAYETFYAAAIGGAVPALYFLAVDVVAGQPLATPSLLGGAMFLGVAPADADTLSITAVALYSLVHFATFGALGFVASFLVRSLEERTGGGFALPALVLYLMVAGGIFVGNWLFMPGVVDAIGQGHILLSSALTALVMTAFLRHAHGSSEGLAGEPGASTKADAGAAA